MGWVGGWTEKFNEMWITFSNLNVTNIFLNLNAKGENQGNFNFKFLVGETLSIECNWLSPSDIQGRRPKVFLEYFDVTRFSNHSHTPCYLKIRVEISMWKLRPRNVAEILITTPRNSFPPLWNPSDISEQQKEKNLYRLNP